MLTLIYGPPAAGKYTVGQELSKLTGHGFLHNHLTADVAKAVFEFRSKPYFDLVQKLRYECIESAASAGSDFIMTYAYSGKLNTPGLMDDDQDLLHYIHLLEKHGSTVNFVRLTAAEDTLIQRVDSESRKKLQKLVDPVKMRKYLDAGERHVDFPHAKSLVINTDNNLPLESANIIAAHYKL